MSNFDDLVAEGKICLGRYDKESSLVTAMRHAVQPLFQESAQFGFMSTLISQLEKSITTIVESTFNNSVPLAQLHSDGISQRQTSSTPIAQFFSGISPATKSPKASNAIGPSMSPYLLSETQKARSAPG